MATISIKEFIVQLLESAPGPLSTVQIYEFFETAGYRLEKASIRGRLNSLTYEGRILRVGFGRYAAWSNQFYNLLVSGSSSAWEQGNWKIPRGRYLEYTEPEVADRFKLLSPDIVGQLIKLPTLFAYEAGVNKAARIGRLVDVHIGATSIDIWFKFDENWPPIEPMVLNKIKENLGYLKNEEFRTHWAIKEFSLYSTLDEVGITRIASPKADLVPVEPSPGPGPQYRPREGKLSEDVSAPSVDEAEKQSSLHLRLRADALKLAASLHRVANRFPELASTSTEYAKLLESNTIDVDVPGVWSVGGALSIFARSYREQNIARTLAEPLEPQLDASLQNVVRQHGAFILGFREGRDLVQRADEFAIDNARIQQIEVPGVILLGELTENRDLVDDRTRALHRPIRDSLAEFGWVGSRVSYTAYLIVRNAVRAIIKYTVGENRSVGEVLAIMTGVSVVAGDPNAEFIRAAVPILQHYGSQLLAFFNHSPEMRAYVEWALHILDIDKRAP